MAVGDYRLTYRDLEIRQGANAEELRAHLDVERDGKSLGSIQAGKNSYRAEDQVSNEVGIRSDKLTLEDLFVVAEQVEGEGQAIHFRVLVKPLVNLIWIAGFVFLVGALVAMWPSLAEQRRLAERYRELRAPARA
jgi:cytochrome c-type biogenesis protein CcmF